MAPSLSVARQVLVDAAFDVLLLHYDLDDGKGDELVKELRASGRAMTVIGVSSHDEGNAALLRAGALSICSKTLFDRIEGVINTATTRAVRAQCSDDAPPLPARPYGEPISC